MKRYHVIICLGVASMIFGGCFGKKDDATKEMKKKTMVRVGDKAPLFSLNDENGKKVSLSDFRGKRVALVFYPLSSKVSFGCKKELCNLRDAHIEKEIVILGISNNTVGRQNKFKESQKLTFPLLSDENAEVAQLYGLKTNVFGIQRITILIDEKGTVVALLDHVALGDHAQQIRDAFKKACEK